ncbi:hypothetical protein ACMA5I_09910 [Paracoccaceae bacterium GXU_MW_L88]
MLRLIALLLIVSFSAATVPGPARMITICAGGETKQIPDPNAPPSAHHHECCLANFVAGETPEADAVWVELDFVAPQVARASAAPILPKRFRAREPPLSA